MVEVTSGDCVVVRDRTSGVERRVNLSSVRAPRVGTRDRAPEPWGLEAKEFLRCVSNLSGWVEKSYCGADARGTVDTLTGLCPPGPTFRLPRLLS